MTYVTKNFSNKIWIFQDYIPVISTVTNIWNVFEKCVYLKIFSPQKKELTELCFQFEHKKPI